MSRIAVTRTSHRLLPDARRVIANPYLPGQEIVSGTDPRAGLLMQRILEIPEAQVAAVLAGLVADFSFRHKGLEEILQRHFDLVAHHLDPAAHPSRERRLLIGAYFTHEYSVEAAALFNPSLSLIHI